MIFWEQFKLQNSAASATISLTSGGVVSMPALEVNGNATINNLTLTTLNNSIALPPGTSFQGSVNIPSGSTFTGTIKAGSRIQGPVQIIQPNNENTLTFSGKLRAASLLVPKNGTVEFEQAEVKLNKTKTLVDDGQGNSTPLEDYVVNKTDVMDGLGCILLYWTSGWTCECFPILPSGYFVQIRRKDDTQWYPPAVYDFNTRYKSGDTHSLRIQLVAPGNQLVGAELELSHPSDNFWTIMPINMALYDICPLMHTGPASMAGRIVHNDMYSAFTPPTVFASNGTEATYLVWLGEVLAWAIQEGRVHLRTKTDNIIIGGVSTQHVDVQNPSADNVPTYIKNNPWLPLMSNQDIGWSGKKYLLDDPIWFFSAL